VYRLPAVDGGKVPLIKDNACLNEPYFRPTTITLEDLGAAGKTVLPLLLATVCAARGLFVVPHHRSFLYVVKVA
jgi:hypothetical protein